MTRVMVIGNAGGGKSTLSRAVSSAHGLPYLAIDDLQWRPGWIETPAAEFEKRHQDIISGDRWLIDGYGPMNTIEARLDACDTVILVDHPIRVHFWWAAKRQVRSMVFGRPDGPEGCPMWRVTFRVFRMIWWLHVEMRPKLLEAIGRREDRVRVIRLDSPAALNAFAANPI